MKEPAVPQKSTADGTIRSFAWKRAAARYGKLAASFFPLYAAAVLSTLLRQTPGALALRAATVSFLLHLLCTPLMVGAAVYAYDIYRFGNAPLSSAFRFYRGGRRATTAALLQSVLLAALFLSYLPAYFSAVLPGNRPLLCTLDGGVGLLLALGWPLLSARLALTSCLFGLDEGKTAGNIMQESLLYTKGRTGRILWFAATILWPLLPVYLAAALFLPLCGGLEITSWPPVLRISAAILPLYLGVPYLSVAVAGYAHKLIPSKNLPVNPKM